MMNKSTKLINITIDRDLLDIFHEYARSKYTNATMLIRQYIMREVNKYEKSKLDKENNNTQGEC